MTITDQKYYGQVYTPRPIVEKMLKPVIAGELANKAIGDPACGSGDFLIPIAEEVFRRIRDKTERTEGLLYTLYHLTGYDIDAEAVALCKQRLAESAERILGYRPDEVGRIMHADALDAFGMGENTFDYVVGNPPYVRIQNLESHRRDRIKAEGWRYFHGASDLYFVFYELGIRLLKEGGELIYISPSGWLRNDAGRAMRKDLATNHTVLSIIDHGTKPVFPKVSTYTCIIHIRRTCDSSVKPVAHKHTVDGVDEDCVLTRGKRWTVLPRTRVAHCGRSKKLGDIADIHIGIQTLADKVFILEAMNTGEDIITCQFRGQTIRLEKEAVRKILKVSVMQGGDDNIHRVVIYPYNSDGKLLPEQEFQLMYPLAYAWLRENKSRLLGRDKGMFDPLRWYAYGRAVSIRSGFGKKILTSEMNKEPNFQMCTDPKALFYSGYCLKPHMGVDWNALLAVLNSDDMKEYIRAYSQPYQSGWYSYAKRYISDFPVSPDAIDA